MLAALREGAVTHLSATPTLLRLILGRLPRDVASDLPLEQITLGGEPASQELLDRLGEMFPAARISHVYAGTEFGSAVAVHDGRSGLPGSLLERAGPVRFRIIDGELCDRSDRAMLGYAHAADAVPDWWPTGDLVEVRGDRIHFIGRSTEIINVGGAKVHPLLLEEVLATVEGVAMAAAYGRPNPIMGQIVAVDVVVEPSSNPDDVIAAVRAACRDLPPAAIPRFIRVVSELRTRAEKVVRTPTAGGPE